MEREARKVQEKQHAGNSKEQVCPSVTTEETDNTYNKGTTRDRMQFKQHRQQRDRLGGGAPPRGDPGQDGTAEALVLRELSVALVVALGLCG